MWPFMAAFTSHNIFTVHPCCSKCQYYIPSYGWTIFYCMDIAHILSILQLMDIWVVSSLELLWKMLWWTFMYKVFIEYRHLILLDICGRVEFMDHMIILSFAFWGAAKLFPIVVTPSYFATSNVWGFRFLHIFTNNCHSPSSPLPRHSPSLCHTNWDNMFYWLLDSFKT